MSRKEKNALVINRKVCHIEASLPSTKRFKKHEMLLFQEHTCNPKSVSSLHNVCKTATSSTSLQWACAKSKAMKGKDTGATSHSGLPKDWQDSKKTQATTASSSIQTPKIQSCYFFSVWYFFRWSSARPTGSLFSGLLQSTLVFQLAECLRRTPCHVTALKSSFRTFWTSFHSTAFTWTV